eukprot:GFUD01018984.1.p1 GENE.GFUD01018984.1~~GFUD01018984.1.p1  ORF type:complete len:201 (+),score=52.98 GFUD01018984.1:48-605(+)
MAWHKGNWSPLFVKEWYAPKASQHVFDPYSFCLVVVGLVFHLLWGTDDIDQWIFGFLLALGLELVWEIVGNTPVVLKRIRENNGTSGEYIGDSIQNILGDLFSCGLGYVLGTLFAAVELWWISLVWVVVSEIVCILYMRDSLLLNIVTLLVHNEKLMQWQFCKVPDTDSQYFISKLWKTNPKKNC